MFLSILQSTDPRMALIEVLLCLPVILFALSLHETAHGFVAWKCGDPTARNLGRLTLNPVRHLDPLGFLCMMIFGFGWAKPVPINSRYFRKPRRDVLLTALAGPASNFLLGVLNTAFSGLFFILALQTGAETYSLPVILFLFFDIAAFLNFSLAIFNLLPIPPFDGSRILGSLIPSRIYFKFVQHERQIMWGVLIVLFIMSYLWDFSPSSYLASLFDNLFTDLFVRLWSALLGLDLSGL